MPPAADPNLPRPGTARVPLSSTPGAGLGDGEPRVGQGFAGFRLVGELGTGAFARVFLARQGELAGRPVVLKVAAGPPAESRTLAQLQHTNIVPVYSAHAVGRYHAVCMPFFGATTLADVLDRVRKGGPPPTGGVFLDTLADRRAAVGLDPPAADPVPHTTEHLDRLAQSSYVDAVLWLAARLADGLDHAHTRGVVHRDLKPANVLLTDDGQPMLLDFNLADATAAGGPPAERVGGTVQYMAPEHLQSFLTGRGTAVDARSDLYALGLILYELLAGRPAFKVKAGPAAVAAASLAKDRAAGPPPLRPHTPAVGPAVESLVLKLLAPAAADRYQSARHLRTDLERQLAHRPLKYAPNPSVRERAAKWVRRHPGLASAGPVAGLAAVLLAGLVLAGTQLLGYRSDKRFREFLAEKARLEATLATGLADPETLPDQVAAGWRAVDGYGVRTDPGWQTQPDVRRLSADHQGRLREAAGELLVLTAIAAGKQPGGADAPAVLADAARAAEQAAGLLPPGAAAVARGEAAGLAARAEGREPPALAVGSPTDPLAANLAAFALVERGRFAEAADLARRAVDADAAGRPATWFLLGFAGYRSGRLAEAEAAYDAALAARADEYPVRLNRGLAREARKKWADAAADFGRCAGLRPDKPTGHLHLAFARKELGDVTGAVAAATDALAAGGDPSQVLFARAGFLRLLGRHPEAEADLAAVRGHTPGTADGWVARGAARRAQDPAAALADFDRALELDPRSVDALRARAAVLADNLNRPADAVRTLDRLLEVSPNPTLTRAGRAVLHARLGDRPAAVADAEAVLAASREPEMTYQMAGVYALTSARHPADRTTALRLLAEALRGGYGAQHIHTDPDLAPLRGDVEYRRLTAAYRP